MPKRTSRRPPVPIEAVDFVMYSAKEPLKLRGWYQEMFGLKKGEEWNRFWSEFDTQPLTLCLNGPPPPHRRTPEWDWMGTPAIAFAVADIHAAAKKLQRRKVRILKGPVETRVCWMLFIEDPEGNRLIIHQRKDGRNGLSP